MEPRAGARPTPAGAICGGADVGNCGPEALRLYFSAQRKTWAEEESELRVRRSHSRDAWTVARALNELRGFLLPFVKFTTAQLDQLAYDEDYGAQFLRKQLGKALAEIAELRRTVGELDARVSRLQARPHEGAVRP